MENEKCLVTTKIIMVVTFLIMSLAQLQTFAILNIHAYKHKSKTKLLSFKSLH